MAPLSSAQAAQDRRSVAPLHRFASRISAALVIPLAGLLILLSDDILSIYKPEFRDAVPLVVILVVGRTVEAIFGPASTIVEMIGHRGLPLLNSLLGLSAWAIIGVLLVPIAGSMGMAIAVSFGIVLVAISATVELRVSDGISLVDAKLLRGIAVALVGYFLMSLAGDALVAIGGPGRAAILTLLLYPAVTWLALRLGLSRQDRMALGKAGRALRLSPHG
jgi:O-antigen/teichoic acid export membrane protein